VLLLLLSIEEKFIAFFKTHDENDPPI